MTSPTSEFLPVFRPLPVNWATHRCFHALGCLPGRVWLDSATAPARGTADGIAATDPLVGQLSRYSFLTADPVLQIRVAADQPDPWDRLAELVSRLPSDVGQNLPPFQGGLVGVLGYEAGRWLEPLELRDCHQHQIDDLPTPALAFGVYDWTIAIDHHLDQGWLICQGFDADDLQPGAATPDAASRIRKANDRADQILNLISAADETANPLPGGGAIDGEIDTRMNDPPSDRVDSNFQSDVFRRAIAEIIERIRRGDSFQVNLAQRLTTDAPPDAAQLYLRLRDANPAPFAGFYDGGDFQVLSSSPEGFLQLRDGLVTTRPIKGTAPRTGDRERDQQIAEQLSASEKDRAENLMIVDLMRNDLSRVCQDRSVRVAKLCQVERYQCVQHLVSVIEGRLRCGVDAVELMRACFPGGSVTGAPKIEAMKTIARLEPNPRGPYCGSLGYVSCGGDADFNILIRTITQAHGKLQIPVGGGITARSNPVAEEAETWAKAAGMLNALPEASRHVTPASGPEPPGPSPVTI